jgi:hypothetical protein
MDKLYCYVLQADRMLPKWLTDAEEHGKHLMSSAVWRAMQSSRLGSESDSELSGTDDSDDSEDDCNSVGTDAEADDGDEISEDKVDEEIDDQELG